MSRRTNESTVITRLDKFINKRRAQMVKERGKAVTLTEVYGEIAQFCDVSPNTISMVKTGQQGCSLTLALRLSEYFDVTVNELFKLEG